MISVPADHANRSTVLTYLFIIFSLLLPIQSDAYAKYCGEMFSMGRRATNLNSLVVSPPKAFIPKFTNENGKVTVYRGDLRGLEETGILSDALKEGDFKRIDSAINIINNKTSQTINNLVLTHGDPTQYSPFVRASLSPALAQINAKGLLSRDLDRNSQTIYKIEVDPNRLIRLPLKEEVRKSGLNYVVLIIGRVDPSEITAIKVDNTKPESELLVEKDGQNQEAQFFSEHPASNEPSYWVRNPSNWIQLESKLR